MGVTIRDVAEYCGVSVATVSRVLRGKPNVAEDTKAKVLMTARQLGYPKLEEVMEESSCLRQVGVIVPRENPKFLRNRGTYGVTWSFVDDVYWGIRQASKERVYQPEIIIHDYEDESEQRSTTRIFDNAFCGYIIVGGWVPRELITVLRKRGLPIITVGVRVSDDIDSIMADNSGGIEECIKYLYDTDHRKIAFINGPLSNINSAEKLSGYYAGMLKVGLEVDAQLVTEVPLGIEGGYQAALGLLEKSVDAIVCGYDAMAIGVLLAAKEKGINVGKELTIVGFGNEIADKSLLALLTTVEVPKAQMGKIALERLLQTIGKSDCTPVHIRVPTKIITPAAVKQSASKQCG